MDQTKADKFKRAIIDRATAMGMDVQQKGSCSPGIKALAQMYGIVLSNPNMLQAFESDLMVHDLGLLASPDAPEQFVWTIRPSGTNLFYRDADGPREFRRHMDLETGSLAFTFDGDKLEPVTDVECAAEFLRERKAA